MSDNGPVDSLAGSFALGTASLGYIPKDPGQTNITRQLRAISPQYGRGHLSNSLPGITIE